MKRNKYEYPTFADYVDGIGKAYGDKPALSSYDRKGQETMLTYQQVSDKAKALAAVFTEKGYKGVHIGIVSENSLEWVIAYLGITASGNVAVCVDAEQSDENVEEMLVMADVSVLFVGEDNRRMGTRMLIDGKIDEIYELEGKGGASVKGLCEEGARLLADGKPYRCPDQNPRDTAALVFTSGTTSIPKMVLLSHHNILINVSDCLEGVEAGPKVFSALPCYHTYGMTTAVLATLVRGAHLCLNGNMRTVMRDLTLSKPYCMVAVPLMVEVIYKQILLGAQKAGKSGALEKILKSAARKRRKGLDFSSPELEAMWQQYFGGLKLIICGGAHLSTEIEGSVRRPYHAGIRYHRVFAHGFRQRVCRWPYRIGGPYAGPLPGPGQGRRDPGPGRQRDEGLLQRGRPDAGSDGRRMVLYRRSGVCG